MRPKTCLGLHGEITPQSEPTLPSITRYNALNHWGLPVLPGIGQSYSSKIPTQSWLCMHIETDTRINKHYRNHFTLKHGGAGHHVLCIKSSQNQLILNPISSYATRSTKAIYEISRPALSFLLRAIMKAFTMQNFASRPQLRT